VDKKGEYTIKREEIVRRIPKKKRKAYCKLDAG
jgi:hypothetical protein